MVTQAIAQHSSTSLTQALLLEELAARKGRDARYSIRNFARDLGVSKTALSDVLGGRRRFSRASALRVVERLELGPTRRIGFLEEHVLRTGSTALLGMSVPGGEDEFQASSDLHSMALLALADLRSSRAEPEWIARKLGISTLEARATLERLVRLGRVEIVSDNLKRPRGASSRSLERIETPQSRRKRAKLALRAAESAIERFPGLDNLFQAQAIAVSRSRLKEAEKMISDFRAAFARRMSTGPVRADAGEACLLSVQFFPIANPSDFRGDES